MAEIFGAGSSVQINRLTTGWTWNVFVSAVDNSIEELRDAKEKALQIERELRETLPTTVTTAKKKSAQPDPVDAPF